ncbi:cobalt-precorrin-5B (C(1))-methyltransferase [Planktothrix agardhii]|uniref:cobalt-precorrin-5B (C(1))-methyltransferase n=1 Tax=Planktothrix agardhii TaxID=1160 RepID=UPI00220232A3|nr:Cobalt-precorrin-5B C(1)-methyltransferase [Planktothrix agardhii]
MTTNQPRSGYTLPVFACAAAMAALEYLQTRNQSIEQVSIDLINPAETVNILIEQIAILTDNSALAITRSDPGDNLDLTRNTPIWAMVEWWDSSEPPPTPPCQGGAKEQSSPPYQGGLGGVNFLILFLSKEEKELAMIKRPDKQQYIVMLKLYY